MISVLEIAVDCPVNKTFSYLPPKDIPLKDIVGKRVKVPFGSRLAIGYVLSVAQMEHKQNANKQLSFTLDLPQSPRPRKLDRHSGLKINLKTIIEIIDDYPIISEESIELARFISQNYVCSIGEALSCIIPQSMQKPKRKAAGQIKPAMTDSSPRKILTPHQQFAFDKITKSLANNEHKDFLLYGVTASGKTEIYLNAIEYALNLGKSAIMLIPEISLTAQFEEIVFKRFGSQAALWHSNISAIEKYKLFYLALNGEIKVMLGARSAVFAPFKNLGLIIIDEEHEHTYKQEQKPSYDCREIAFWRARRHNACVVLGSATPSLETYKSSLENNIEIIRLPQRIDAKKLPDIKIISLKDKPRFGGLLLSETVRALSETLAKKEQAIVFLNRRGYSPSIMCRNCSVVYQCPNCSISMVYHKHGDLLKCHYCGLTQKLPIICPACKSKDMSIFGIGTQKVEDELKKMFPKSSICRLDSDTASKKGAYEKAYRGLKTGEYDILLGTQMIAKGFDFERVSLVCIIDADTSLYLPDFRSAEKTFQLITQVAGRCGRGQTAGNVIIQTSHPQHYAIKYAQNYDFDSFYKTEMSQRQTLCYPPYCEIAKITIKNKEEERAEEEAKNLMDFLKDFSFQSAASSPDLQILGPASAYILKLNNIFRKHIIIKGSKTAVLKISTSVSSYKNKFSQSQIIVEIMPSNLI